MTLLVAHHHGFKCAGSSVVHVLNRAWPDRVLHIEHARPDHRIGCATVRSHVARGDYCALTSHLLTMPAPGEQLAHVHFALVRDPLERLRSAYAFVQRDFEDVGFEGFLARLEHQAENFHVRLLAVPAADPGDGWRCAPEAVPLGEPHVLLGLVERFEDSMFLLERRLAAMGHSFDASYARRHNVGSGEQTDVMAASWQRLRERNAEDYALIGRIGVAMDRELEESDPGGTGRADYRRRCDARSGVDEEYLGLDPRHWTYVES